MRMQHKNEVHHYFVSAGIFSGTFQEDASKRFYYFCESNPENYFKD